MLLIKMLVIHHTREDYNIIQSMKKSVNCKFRAQNICIIDISNIIFGKGKIMVCKRLKLTTIYREPSHTIATSELTHINIRDDPNSLDMVVFQKI